MASHRIACCVKAYRHKSSLTAVFSALRVWAGRTFVRGAAATLLAVGTGTCGTDVDGANADGVDVDGVGVDGVGVDGVGVDGVDADETLGNFTRFDVRVDSCVSGSLRRTGLDDPAI